MFARNALKLFRVKMDPGVIMVQSFWVEWHCSKITWWHGCTGFSNAIDVAANLVDHGFIPDVSAAIKGADQIRDKRKIVNE